MTPAIVRKQIRIKASAEALWPYIGTTAGLRQWWGSHVVIEPKVGGYCEERGHAPGAFYRLCGQVTVYDPPHHLELVLRNPDGGVSWPVLTTLRITLQQEGEETLVTLVHQAFGALPEVTCQLEVSFDLPVDKSHSPVTFNRLGRRHPLALQTAAHVPPLHPLLAAPLLDAVRSQQWLASQSIEWTARAQRWVALMAAKESKCHLS